MLAVYRLLHRPLKSHFRIRLISGKALVADFEELATLKDSPEAYSKLEKLNAHFQAARLTPAQLSSIIASAHHLRDEHSHMQAFITHAATLVPKHRYTPAQMVSILTGLRNVRPQNEGASTICITLTQQLDGKSIVPGIKTIQALCQLSNNRLVSPHGDLSIFVSRFLSASLAAGVYLPLDAILQQLSYVRITYDQHPLLLYYTACITSQKTRILSTSNRVYLLNSMRHFQFHHVAVQQLIHAIMTTGAQTPPDISANDYSMLCGVLRSMPVVQYETYLPVLQYANTCLSSNSEFTLTHYGALKSMAACRNMSNTHPDVATFIHLISERLPQDLSTATLPDQFVSSAFFGMQCMTLTDSTRRLYSYLFALCSERLSTMPSIHLANIFCGLYHIPSVDAKFVESILHELLQQCITRIQRISLTSPDEPSMSFIYNAARHLQLFEHSNSKYLSAQTRYLILCTKLQLLPFLFQHPDPSNIPAASKVEGMLYENCVMICKNMHPMLRVSNRGHMLGFQCDIIIEIEHPAYKLNIEIDGLFHLDAYKVQFCHMRDELFKSRGVDVLRLNVRHYDDTFAAVHDCSEMIKSRLENHLLSVGLLRSRT